MYIYIFGGERNRKRDEEREMKMIGEEPYQYFKNKVDIFP